MVISFSLKNLISGQEGQVSPLRGMVLSDAMGCIEHDAKAQVTQAVDLQGHIAQAQVKVLLGKFEQLVGLNYGS